MGRREGACRDGSLRYLTSAAPRLDASRVTTYDRIDWHIESAIEAGQPAEHGSTHIGLYLAWLIRRDLHDPATFASEHLGAVKAGEMTGSALMDDIDGKLVSDVMSPEGRAFSDARYEAYLAEFAAMFDSLPDYSVEDGPDAYARVEPVLDRLYAEWVAGGRQAPAPKVETDELDLDVGAIEQVFMAPSGFSQEQIDELLAEVPGEIRVVSPESVPKSHVSAKAESLIPVDLTTPPMQVESVHARKWGSSLLTRALKRLGVAPKDSVVVYGIGGDGERTLVVTVYDVAGIDAARLTTEFRSVIFHLPGSTWESRTIAGKQVQWASGDEFTVAFWARDGMVLHVAGQPEVVVPAVSRLP